MKHLTSAQESACAAFEELAADLSLEGSVFRTIFTYRDGEKAVFTFSGRCRVREEPSDDTYRSGSAESLAEALSEFVEERAKVRENPPPLQLKTPAAVRDAAKKIIAEAEQLDPAELQRRLDDLPL